MKSALVADHLPIVHKGAGRLLRILDDKETQRAMNAERPQDSPILLFSMKEHVGFSARLTDVAAPVGLSEALTIPVQGAMPHGSPVLLEVGHVAGP